MGAREFGCEAISHLEEISEAGTEAMAAAGSVAVILPTTAYILRLRPPPVRRMIDQGVIVALGTDFNPNAFCLSMVIILVFLLRPLYSYFKCLFPSRHICMLSVSCL